MPRYLLVYVGCIECRDPTRVERIVDQPPDGYRIVSVGEGIELDYEESRIAIPLPEESAP